MKSTIINTNLYHKSYASILNNLKPCRSRSFDLQNLLKEKLTLTIDKEVKKQAREFVKQREVSISGMVDSYLKTLSEKNDNWKPKKGSIVTEISGSVQVKNVVEYDELLEEALMEKHGYEYFD